MKRHKGKKFTMKIGKVPKAPKDPDTTEKTVTGRQLPPRPLGGIHTELTDWTERKKKKEQIK